jgi:hypothetical protein
MCKITNPAGQTVSTSPAEEALVGTEVYDTANMHAGTSATILMPTTGVYAIDARVWFANGPVGMTYVGVKINAGGTTPLVIAPPPGGIYATVLNGGLHYYADGGDTVQCWVQHDAPGDLYVELMDFTVTWVGAV